CLVVPLLTATRFVPAWIAQLQVKAPTTQPASEIATSIASEDGQSVDHLVTRRAKPVSTSTQTALVLTLVYALVIFGRGIRLLRFWRRKEKLRRSAVDELAPEIDLTAQRCRKLLGVSEVAVARCDKTRVPYTLGARRPLILLPSAFCSGADEPRLLSVIGHEMAHVARRDFLSNLVCEVVSLPISFHPLTFLIKRQIDRTRELACDELVTQHVLAPRVYARSLLWAADVSRQYPSQAFMLSIFDGRILEERIMKLTRNKRRVTPGMARLLMLASLLVLGLSAVSLSLFSFELQTQARAVRDTIVQPLQTASMPVSQDPAPTTAPAPSQEIRLNAPSPQERAQSACNAGRRGDVESIPALIAMLGDDTDTELVKCWDSGRWSPALETFKHPSPGEQAAIALASFGSQAFVPLSNQLDSSNATVRRNAAWAIGELTNMRPGQRAGAVPQLISLLSDSDEWVRMAAARALGEVRDRRALDELISRLADDNWRVRQVVTWALSERKDERAVAALCNVLLTDVSAEVRRGAADALGEISSAGALPSLKQALNDSEASVSAKAAWAISEIEG
ncbi:MAG TPA: M56 family metallopeptidase, partial [Pyrinomonadaceae bacterium]